MASTPFSGESWDIVRSPSTLQSLPCKRYPLRQSPHVKPRPEPSFEDWDAGGTMPLYIPASEPVIDFSLFPVKTYDLVTPSWSPASSSPIDESRGSSVHTPEPETDPLSRQDRYSHGRAIEVNRFGVGSASCGPHPHAVISPAQGLRHDFSRSDISSLAKSSEDGIDFLKRSPPITGRSDLPGCDELHAFDAKVLAYASFDDQVITSPNASWAPEYPLVDPLGILKRKDGFWGPQEYTRWPQLFVPSSVHHACIPFRRAADPTKLVECDSYMWFSPTESATESVFHFVRDKSWNRAVDPRTGEGLCGFERSFLDMVGLELDRISLKVHAAGSDKGVLGAKEIYTRCLRNGHSVLDDLRRRRAPYRELMLGLRDVQRSMLELSGLLYYLDQVVGNIYRKIEGRREPRMDIRGAFTTDPQTVKLLYKYGIPVWFIQARYCLTPSVRILKVVECDSWSNYLAKDFPKTNGKSLWYGWNFDLQPKWRVFAETQLLNKEHMAELLSNIYQFQGLTCAPVSGIFALSSQPSPDRMPVRIAPELPLTVPKPSPQGKKSKAGPSAKATKDPSPNYARFLFIPKDGNGEPDLPPFCPAVHRALTSLGTVGEPSSPAAMYPLPPPFFLVHQTTQKSADLYLNYIRIRPILFDLLVNGGHFDKAVWRRLRDWRTILHGDYKKPMKLPPNATSPIVDCPLGSLAVPTKRPHPDNAEVPGSKRRRSATKTAIKVTFGVEKELAPFDREKPQSWRGRVVTADDIVHDKVLRQEVQWELMESLFRYEFYALDQAVLPRLRMSAEEHHSRNRMINRIFKGPSDPVQNVAPDLSTLQVEYWGDKLDEDSLYALRHVLEAWPQFPSVLTGAKTLTDADFELMIHFYTKTFARFFHRIPSMHCRTPQSLTTNYSDLHEARIPSSVHAESNE